MLTATLPQVTASYRNPLRLRVTAIPQAYYRYAAVAVTVR
jgi:hypothetical protein